MVRLHAASMIDVSLCTPHFLECFEALVLAFHCYFPLYSIGRGCDLHLRKLWRHHRSALSAGAYIRPETGSANCWGLLDTQETTSI